MGTSRDRPSPVVLAVGDVGSTRRALDDGDLQVNHVDSAGEALDELDSRPVDCLLVPYDGKDLSGVELAAIADDRVAVPTVVLGDDISPLVTDAPGVAAVCSPTKPARVTDAIADAVGQTPSTALSEATLDALEDLYELDHATQSIESWLEAVVQIGCRRLDLPYGFVTRIDSGTQHIVAAVGDNEQLQAGESAPLSKAYCRHTIEADDVVGFSDIHGVDWVGDRAYDAFGLSCYLGSRIETDEDLYGTICFADRETRSNSFSAEEQTFVKLLTNWVRYELSRHERQSELRLKDRVMDEAEIGITISDPNRPDNPIIYANDGFERVTGYSPADVVGRNCRFLQGVNTDPATVDRIREAIEAGESIVTELRNYRKDGTEFWSRLQIYPITEAGDVINFVGFQRDVTERKERERELEAYETAIDTAADSIYRLDPEGRFRMVNDAVCSMTGYDREQLRAEHVSMLLTDDDAARTERHIADAVERNQQDVISLTVTVERNDGTTFPAESRIVLLTDDGSHQGTVMVTRDISDRRAHERTLTELHDVSQTLLGAQSSQAISDAVAEAADEILDVEAVGVYRFDEQTNRLEPASIPAETEALVGPAPTFGPGDGLAWEAFLAGENCIYDDVSSASDVYNPDTPIRSELFVPIGEYGLLICGSTVTAAYDRQMAELADLLVASPQAAYDRMERDHRLRERERELREQNHRLEQLDEVNDRVRRICHELVGATTRDEIDQILATGLAAVDGYKFVWIGERDHVTGHVDPRTVAGTQHGYLDAVDPNLEANAAEPTVRALMTHDAVVVDRIADGLHSDRWQQEALTRDYRSVASVPIRHGGLPYGVVSVYADRADEFDTETRTVLTELAETAAHAIAALEQRQALLSEQHVQLVFGLQPQPTTLFAVATELDGQLTVRRLLPRSDDETLVYGTVSAADQTTFERVCRDSPGVERLHLTETDGDESRFELHLSGPSLGTTVADHGGSFDQLTIDDGHGTLAATFPAGPTVSEFTQLFTDRYDGVELCARKRREEDEADDGTVLESLTERQRETLEVAHERGFYEWPRASTGEEIASSLDIAAPTFLEHLRHAESKLVDWALDSDSLDNVESPQ